MYIKNKNGQIVKLDKPPIRENFRYKTRECYNGPLTNMKPWMKLAIGLTALLVVIFILWLIFRKKQRRSSFGYKFFK